MARIRSIKPEFPQSESMGNVSRDARLLFIELWTICDDEGRTRAASRMLASLLFPYDDDAAKLIDGWLMELEREGCIVRYVIDGATYLQVCNWLNHQKIDKPSRSKIPQFGESSRILSRPRELSSEDQGVDQGVDQGSKPIASGDKSPSAEKAKLNGHDQTPVIERIPLVGSEEFEVHQSSVEEWERLFPAVDVPQTLKEIRAWNLANTPRRKTRRGVMNHITQWLAKEQNKPAERGRYG